MDEIMQVNYEGLYQQSKLLNGAIEDELLIARQRVEQLKNLATNLNNQLVTVKDKLKEVSPEEFEKLYPTPNKEEA